jgi:crotonobetainyl-CoA:carnitine CoA-transferase CaiB-like acyl-CoA transferase
LANEGNGHAAVAPLAGVRVLELSDGRSSAAVCGRLLADLGATVDKAEQPDCDTIRRIGPALAGGGSMAAAWLLAGKRTQAVAAGESGAERLLPAARRSDVVIIDDWGLRWLAGPGLATWRTALTGAVVGVLTPFGQDSDLPGSELVSQAIAGIPSITGQPGGPPVRVGVPISTDITAIIGAGALCAALYRQRRTGEGAWIDLAGYDSMVMMQGNYLPGYFTTGKIPERAGNVQLLSAPWNSYPTTDG